MRLFEHLPASLSELIHDDGDADLPLIDIQQPESMRSKLPGREMHTLMTLPYTQ